MNDFHPPVCRMVAVPLGITFLFQVAKQKGEKNPKQHVERKIKRHTSETEHAIGS